MSNPKKAVPPHLARAAQRRSEEEERALVPFDKRASEHDSIPSRTTSSTEKSSPKEFLQERMIKALQEQLESQRALHELAEIRCTKLSVENAELKKEILRLQTAAPAVDANHQHDIPAEPLAKEQLDIITQILQDYNMRLDKQDAQILELATATASDRRDSGAATPPARGDQLSKMQDNLEALSNDMKRLIAKDSDRDRMFEQEMRIDDAFTKEQLTGYYEELLTNQGPFISTNFTEDQLWSLKSRVRRRLATIDLESATMEEINKKMTYIGILE